MRYYISDGFRYIACNSVTITLNKSEAGLWERDKAIRICKATKHSKFRRKFYWFLVSEEEADRPIICTQTNDFDVFISSNPSKYEIRQYSLMLNEKYKEITAVITDLYHIIELSKADNQEKIKRYDELQDALQRRRKIKDNLTILLELFTRDKELDEVQEHLLNRQYRFRSEQFCGVI